jgi:hypothetical protein
MKPRCPLRPVTTALALLPVLAVSPALAQDAPGPSCTIVKNCADLIVTIAAELKQENETLRRMITAVAPAGAVVAFDLKDGCPDGLAPYTAAPVDLRAAPETEDELRRPSSTTC